MTTTHHLGTENHQTSKLAVNDDRKEVVQCQVNFLIIYN